MFRRTIPFLLLFLLPGAAAQGAVYLTADNLSGDVNNIRYDASAQAPEDGKAYAAFGQGATTYTTFFDHTVSQDLSPGSVEAIAYLSCDRPTVYRPPSPDRPTASVSLLKGETAVASASLESTRTCDGPDDVWEAVFALDATAATFAPGDTLSLEFLIWWVNPPPGETHNGYFMVGAEGSGLFGPGLPGDPALAAEDAGPMLVTGAFNETIDHSFSNATSDTYLLNTTIDGPRDLALDVAPTSGNVSIRVLDADGVLFSEVFTEAGETEARLEGASGTWSVELDYTEFTGTLQLRLSAPPEDNTTQETETQTTSPPSETATGGPTGNGTASDGEDSPALPAAVLLLALAFVARRRR